MSERVSLVRVPRNKSRWSIHWTDRMARHVIRLGGFGVILAVILVVVVLLINAAPVFHGATVGTLKILARPVSIPSWIRVGSDEHNMLLWGVDREGVFHAATLQQGEWIESFARQGNESTDARVTTVQKSEDGSKVLLGFSNGLLRLHSLDFQSSITPLVELDAALQERIRHSDSVQEGAVYRLRSSDQVRVTRLMSVPCIAEWKLPDAINCADFFIDKETTNLDQVGSPASVQWIAAVGTRIYSNRSRLSRSTDFDEKTTENSLPNLSNQTHPSIDISSLSNRPIVAIRIGSRNERATVVDDRGELFRLKLSSNDHPTLVDRFFASDRDESPNECVDVCSLLGRESLYLSFADGDVSGYFEVRTLEGSPTTPHLARVHHIESETQERLRLAASPMARMIASIQSNGRVAIRYTPTEELISELHFPIDGKSLLDFGFSPRGDQIFALDQDHLYTVSFDPGYPEVRWRSLLMPVWYEGYDKPRWIWQSSSGVHISEVKLSLVPLLFGTFKATLYAMLIAIPLALLSALYTSEFVDRRIRNWIKPAIEWMATVPSVVLGFVAAFVLAPLLSESIAPCLVSILLIPLGYFVASLLWKKIPVVWKMRFPMGRPIFLCLILPICVASSLVLSPSLEKFLFAMPFKDWLASQHGESVVASFLGPYQERNAVLVGIVLGFAVIPIIYTLAEDALQSVPQHLRAASFGCGATEWQTTIRVVVPSATSGLFGAVMMGFGRAVGETMIVLMAAGNTPLMDLNPFDGLRALSATIATELPEAAVGSTHYRTLFLAALLLFAATLIANSMAEWVRLKIRQRSNEQ